MTSNTDRLDRIESALERTQQQVEANTQDIQQLTQNIQQLAAIAQTHQQTLQIQQQGNNQIFEALIEEVRGLRTENRRIFDHLFGQTDDQQQ